MVTIPFKNYVDNKDAIYLTISDTIPDLTPYHKKSVNMMNNKAIVIGGIEMPAWCLWFIPYVTNTDFVGYVAYPSASRFYVLGHTKNGYFLHQVY
ncbi:hypothetical protein MKC73_20215 [[Clostridium] innocuum]|nr:hypothetical protein [[Clostridium] innocuum]